VPTEDSTTPDLKGEGKDSKLPRWGGVGNRGAIPYLRGRANEERMGKGVVWKTARSNLGTPVAEGEILPGPGGPGCR